MNWKMIGKREIKTEGKTRNEKYKPWWKMKKRRMRMKNTKKEEKEKEKIKQQKEKREKEKREQSRKERKKIENMFGHRLNFDDLTSSQRNWSQVIIW